LRVFRARDLILMNLNMEAEGLHEKQAAAASELRIISAFT
jgi:hypothetical protein